MHFTGPDGFQPWVAGLVERRAVRNRIYSCEIAPRRLESGVRETSPRRWA